MPIWFELLILLLITYAIGLGIGWALWGRTPAGDSSTIPQDTTSKE